MAANDPLNAPIAGDFGASEGFNDTNPKPVKPETGKAQAELDMAFRTDPLNVGTDFQGVDPEDAVAGQLEADFDPEESIYGTPQGFSGLVGKITHTVGDTIQGAAQGVDQFVNDPQRGDDLGHVVQGIQGIIQSLPIDESGSTQQLLSDTVGGVGQAARAVGGGVADAMVESANTIDDLLTTGLVHGASTLFGKTPEQLQQEHPNLFTTKHREIPDWLKPQGDLEGVVHTGTQWYAPFKALGTVGKLGAVANALGATSKALESLPGLSQVAHTAETLSAEYPRLTNLVKVAKDALAFEGKDILANATAFGAHEENLANILEQATGDNPLLGRDLWRALKSSKEDDALLGRVKNGLVSQFGTTAASALLSSVRILKALRGINGELKGALDKARLSQLLGDIDLHSAEFQGHIDEISQRDPAELLNQIFGQEEPKLLTGGTDNVAQEAAQESTAMVPNDDLDGSQLDGGDGPSGLSGGSESQTSGGDGRSKAAVEIYESDSPHEAAGKVLDNQDPLDADQQEAIRQLLQEKMHQTNEHFDEDAFQASINDALENGETIDIHEEILAAIPDKALENTETFQQVFPRVVKSTLQGVTRYVPHSERLNRALSIFGFDPGVERSTKALTGLHYAGDTQNALKIQIKVLENKVGESLILYGEAKASKDAGLIDEAYRELSRWSRAKTQAEFEYGLIGSELGRFLNERKIKVTDEQAMAAAHRAVQEAVEKARRNLPIYAKDGDTLSKEEADVMAAAAMDLYKGISGKGPGWRQKAAKYTSIFINSALGRMTFTGPLGTLYGGAFGGAYGAVGGSVIGGVGGAITHPDDPLGGYQKGATSGFNAGWALGSGVGAVGGGVAGVAGGMKGLKFTLGATQEIFYNNVLAHFSTLKSIGLNNALLKGYDTAGTGLGALAKGDMAQVQRTLDETGAFVRYMGEGVAAGLSVLAKGEKHPWDYTANNARVISKDGLRQYFGASAGDVLKGTKFEHFGNFSDKVVDNIGRVVNFPTGNMIGGLDTVFKVANMRAIIYTELKGKARDLYSMNEAAAHAYAAQHLDFVTHELIMGRAMKFKPGMPTYSGVFSRTQLKNINAKIIGSTDQFSLSHPLRASESAFNGGPKHSDRWIFKTGAKIDDLARQFGFAGTWTVPFAKTFFNAVQYGADNIPVLNRLSGTNREILKGNYGREAQYNLLGRTWLGAGLAAIGAGASMTGLVAPITGSRAAVSQQRAITGEGNYTLRIPIDGQKSATVRFDRMSPISDMMLSPARWWQWGSNTLDGGLDPGAATVSAMAMGTEAFSVGRFVRGASVGVDSLLNPTYSTADSLYRNVVVGGVGSVVMPGGRALDQVSMFTDPEYRDFNTLKEYVAARTPGVNNQMSPLYDPFGNERPRDDYIGTTQDWALNLTRGLTVLGVKYTPNDKISDELSRFGVQGYALTPPSKNVSRDGVMVALDHYRNAKGESLWDLSNKLLREDKRVGAIDGKMVTLREALNQLVHSEDYVKHQHDNTVSRVTGKTNRFVGSRWGSIQGLYSYAKDRVYGKFGILWSAENLNDYKDPDGNTLEKDLNDAKLKKSEAQLGPDPNNPQ